MGCNASNMVKVQPAEVIHVNTDSDTPSLKTGKQTKSRKNLNTDTGDSVESLRKFDGQRGKSATSKDSTDSGLGDDNAHIITENSDPNLVQSVEEEFSPKEDIAESEAPEKLKAILCFTTGSEEIPILGCNHREDQDGYDAAIEFPRANTCANLLLLPVSLEYKTFCERIDAAIFINIFTTE